MATELATGWTDYQKGGFDFRAWASYEIALMIAEAGPLPDAEGVVPHPTPEQAVREKALLDVKAKLEEMALEPEPLTLADLNRELKGRHDASLADTSEDAFPFTPEQTA